MLIFGQPFETTIKEVLIDSGTTKMTFPRRELKSVLSVFVEQGLDCSLDECIHFLKGSSLLAELQLQLCPFLH